MAVNVIPQGEQAVFVVKSNRVNFSFDDNRFVLEIIYGMAGQRVTILKKDFEKVEGEWRFSFDTSNMIGQLTARLTMYMNDPDCPDDERPEVDEQLIGFVATTPCTRLHQCPKCGGQHDVTYEYING
jgi:hypothetical protein